MNNELTEFNNQYMAKMANYALVDTQIKKATEKHKELKEQIQLAMEEYGIQSIDNDYCKISCVAGSESTSIDLKEFQKKEPVEHAQLLQDYPKITTRKPTIRIVVK